MDTGAATALAIGSIVLASCTQLGLSQPAERKLSPIRQEYIAPSITGITQTAFFDRGQTEVRDAVVRGLQEKGLIIEHTDPKAGEIVARYSGDPEPYVDCGMLVHKIASGSGEQVEQVPAARETIEYTLRSDKTAVPILRQMWLDGWMIVRIGPGGRTTLTHAGNVLVEPSRDAALVTTLPAGAVVTILGPSGEKGWYRVKADHGTAAYIADSLVRKPAGTAVTVDTTYVVTRMITIRGGDDAQRTREIISFVTGESDRFGGATQCAAKGTMEHLALQP